MGKKRKCEWKPSVFPEQGFEGLVSFEELEDYNLDDYVNDKSILQVEREKEVECKVSNKRKKCLTPRKHGSSCEWTVTSLKKRPLKTDSRVDHAICEPENLSKDNITGHMTGPNDLKIMLENISSNVNELEDGISGMEAWSPFNLETCILKALFHLGFKKPTEIQAQTLHPALAKRDILGAAETGSGKTLAFGIPIIQGILHKKRLSQGIKHKSFGEKREKTMPSYPSRKNLFALILTPTRELAVQVKNHLTALAKYSDVTVAVVVGGLASQKQERLLKRRPEIVVATPGRLWEMIETGNDYLQEVDNISFLAIDETDRMLEKGHFQELQTLLKRVNADETQKRRRQNFVFSATLTMVHEPPKYIKKGSNDHLSITPGQKLQQIISSLGITNPKVVDITHEKGTASSLSEAKIVCSLEEKDSYLYYFILNHVGRTLVFCNSISCVRRLSQILQVLERKLYPLHAKMEQKQRLKNLEHFRDDPNGLLLATDVAARGLDIPDVQHVIHYQVPQTTESYVHRSGRTARVKKEGLTVLIMEPREAPNYIRIYKSLGRDKDLPDFPVDEDLLEVAKERVSIAKLIENLEHTWRRHSSEVNWFQKAAKEMDMLLDEDQIPKKINNEESENIKQKIRMLRSKLKSLLCTRILPKTASLKYPNPSDIIFNEPQSAVDKVKKKTHTLVKILK